MKIIFIIITTILLVSMTGTIIGLGIAYDKERSKSSDNSNTTPFPVDPLPNCIDVEDYEDVRNAAIFPVERLALLGTNAVKTDSGTFEFTRLVSPTEAYNAYKMVEIALGYNDQNSLFSEIDQEEFEEFKKYQSKLLGYHQTLDSIKALNSLMNEKCSGGYDWIEPTLETLVNERAELIEHLTKDWTDDRVGNFLSSANSRIMLDCKEDERYQAFLKLFEHWEYVVTNIMKDDIETRTASLDLSIHNSGRADANDIRIRTEYFNEIINVFQNECNFNKGSIDTQSILDWANEQWGRGFGTGE